MTSWVSKKRLPTARKDGSLKAVDIESRLIIQKQLVDSKTHKYGWRTRMLGNATDPRPSQLFLVPIRNYILWPIIKRAAAINGQHLIGL